MADIIYCRQLCFYKEYIMKYVVTGGAGYVGSALCQLLIEKGHSVTCLDNFYKGQCDSTLYLNRYKNYEFQFADVRSRKDLANAIQGCDVVVNLAAIVGVPMCKVDPYNVYPVNVGGVQNVVDILNEYPGKVLIQASTDSVFGAVDVHSDESTKPNPQSTYGTSKLEAEKVILNNISKYNPVIIRFSTGMGLSNSMRRNLLVNDLVFTALDQRLLTIFEPDVHRTFINVADMARSIIHFADLAVNNKNQYNLYCIGDDKLNFTKRELAELVREKTGCKVLYIENQKDPDQRNYKINHKRMYETGFSCSMSMEATVDELIKTYPQIRFERKYQ